MQDDIVVYDIIVTMSKCMVYKVLYKVHGSRNVADWFLGYALTRVGRIILKPKLVHSSLIRKVY